MTGFMHIGFGIVLTTLTNVYTSVFVIGEIPFLGGVSVRTVGPRCPPGSRGRGVPLQRLIKLKDCHYTKPGGIPVPLRAVGVCLRVGV